MKRLLLVAAIAAAVPGCGLTENFCRTTTYEPEYWHAQTKSKEWSRHLAEQVWRDTRQHRPKCAYSADYRQGFVDGFSDYLEFGGPGTPPAVPPRQYWKVQCQTPEGHQAIQDWFAGFQEGVQAAKDSGCRRWMTVPSPCVCVCQAPAMPPSSPGPLPPPESGSMPTPAAPIEQPWQILPPSEGSLTPASPTAP